MEALYSDCDLAQKDGICITCYRYEICKEALEIEKKQEKNSNQYNKED